MPSPLDDFVTTFGSRDGVLKEVHSYWERTGHITSPQDLYAHLMQNRVSAGEISPERAQVLQQQFDSSFTPEHTTGYYAKDRRPLIDALAQNYTEAHPDHPLLRVEGDIGNLGGLNKSMNEAARNLQASNPQEFERLAAQQHIPDGPPDERAAKLGRATADAVIGTMSGIVRKHLGEVADVSLLTRNGGDEIGAVVVPKQGMDIHDVKKALTQVQTEIDQFAQKSGLGDITHLKYTDNPGKAGVGIGLDVIDMRHGSPALQQFALDAGITDAKQQRERSRAGRPEGSKTANIEQVAATLESDAYKGLRPAREAATASPEHAAGGAISGNTPEEARLNRMQAQLNPTETDPLSRAEKQALDGTHALTARRDPVTGMPMLGNMQSEQLPNFMEKIGNEHGGAKLVHVDFSNMAGGNLVGSSVGDAMGKRYGESLNAALEKQGLEELKPYVAAKPGGKFALLVPADMPAGKLDALQGAIKSEVEQASKAPLELSSDTKDLLRKKVQNDSTLQKVYGASGERLFDANGDIPMENIANPKTGLTGVDVSMAASQKPIDPKASLGNQLHPLEVATETAYDATTDQRLTAEGKNGGGKEGNQPGNQPGLATGGTGASAQAETGANPPMAGGGEKTSGAQAGAALTDSALSDNPQNPTAQEQGGTAHPSTANSGLPPTDTKTSAGVGGEQTAAAANLSSNGKGDIAQEAQAGVKADPNPDNAHEVKTGANIPAASVSVTNLTRAASTTVTRSASTAITAAQIAGDGAAACHALRTGDYRQAAEHVEHSAELGGTQAAMHALSQPSTYEHAAGILSNMAGGAKLARAIVEKIPVIGGVAAGVAAVAETGAVAYEAAHGRESWTKVASTAAANGAEIVGATVGFGADVAAREAVVYGSRALVGEEHSANHSATVQVGQLVVGGVGHLLNNGERSSTAEANAKTQPQEQKAATGSSDYLKAARDAAAPAASLVTPDGSAPYIPPPPKEVVATISH